LHRRLGAVIAALLAACLSGYGSRTVPTPHHRAPPRGVDGSAPAGAWRCRRASGAPEPGARAACPGVYTV